MIGKIGFLLTFEYVGELLLCTLSRFDGQH